MKVPFLLVDPSKVKWTNASLLSWGKKAARLTPNLQDELEKAGVRETSEHYWIASFLTSVIYGFGISLFIFLLLFTKEKMISFSNVSMSLALFFVFFLMFILIFSHYPRILAQQYANSIDQGLLFALQSVLIQTSSGISLFDSMHNVSKGRYGAVSKEFERVVREISNGESEIRALEKLAYKTRSEYLKKVAWQLITSLKSGSSLKTALSNVLENLTNQQFRSIKNYGAELNMIILVYLMLAAAIPALGVTFLVILSAMAGASIGPTQLVSLVIGAAILQIVLIGLVKTRVPKVLA